MEVLNMQIKLLLGVCLLLLFLVSLAGCSKSESPEAVEYNYIYPAELKARLDAGEIEAGTLTMVSSQTEEECATGFLPDAYLTYSRPLTSDDHFAKLDPFLDIAKNTEADIVIICPRGQSGATRPFDYFLELGINRDRMLILEGGQEAYNKEFPEDIVY
jgi:hypothetical protein